MNWEADGVVKDFSVTAWGTNHEVIVRHSDSS